MRKSILYLFFILFFHASFGQIIPDSMRVDWSGAGYGGCLPNPSLVLNVLNFGGSGDSITNNLTAINAALDSLHGQPGVIWFPAGIYSVSSTISIPSGAILRGAGADSTKLKMKHAGYGFSFAGTASGSFVNILGGYQKGSNRIHTVTGHGLVQGDYAEILETNGAWNTVPISWATDVVGQVVKITEVHGDTLILQKPLRLTYDSALTPRIRKLLPVTNAGMESMKIFRDDTSKTASSYNISFEKAAYCWVKGVEANVSMGSHCMISLSTNIEVSGCYFHHANNYDGGGTRGYGVTLNNHAGQCLIENNLFRHLRHAMMTKCGANGNVFTYNYSVDPFRNGAGETPSNGCGDISLHGHYSYANLFEGNVVQTIWIDQTWGPSGPYNTFFRNRAELFGIVTTSIATERQIFVGNEVTNPSGMYGQYIVSTPGTFEYGNIVRGAITPMGTDTLNDLSYFYSSRPDLWDQPDWNLIGIPYTPNSTKIPAQRRDAAARYTSDEMPLAEFQYAVNYDSVYFRNYSVNTGEFLWDFGDGTTSTEVNPSHLFTDTGLIQVCLTAGNGCVSDSVCKTLWIMPNRIHETNRLVSVFPNPATESVSVNINTSFGSSLKINLFDISGKCVKSFTITTSDTRLNINLKDLPDGVYPFEITGNNLIYRGKIVKTKF